MQPPNSNTSLSFSLYTSSQLLLNNLLSTALTSLVNSAFLCSKNGGGGAQDVASKWDSSDLRFSSVDALHAMLSDPRSVMAVAYASPCCADDAGTTIAAKSEEQQEERFKQPIACAAAIPWAGGWRKEGAATERGWEIKTVCVSEAYTKRGVAGALMAFLESYLVRAERRCLGQQGGGGGGEEEEEEEEEVPDADKAKVVALWILAADCINGVYWRKKGFREVRRRTEGPGVWGCKGTFDMVVLKREVHVVAGGARE